MIRVSLPPLAAAAALALSLTAAAQTVTEKPAPKKPPYTQPPETSAPQTEGTQTVIVSGCLEPGTTPGTYVLAAQQTPLAAQMSQRISGTVPSSIYQLYGHASQLQGLVGHRVQVKGTTPRKPEKTVGERQQSTQPKAQGTSGQTPTVETQTKAKVELRRLDVQTLSSVQGACK